MFYCPKCKSREIYAVAGGYLGQVYLCKDCGYRGSFILEVDDEPDPEKDQKNDKHRK